MAIPFLHGVETVHVNTGVRPVTVVRSAVVALVGVAPKGAPNELTLVLSDTDAAAFGAQLPGFTIPQALDAIRQNGPAPILVVNVYDPLLNSVTETLEAHTLANSKLKLSFAPLGDVSIFTSTGTPIVAVKDTDYKIDEFGNFINISTTFSDATIYKFTYDRFDPTSVTNSQIIGSVTDTERTGLKAFEVAYNLFGFKPKIFIAPGFSTIAAVAAALRVEAPKYRGVDIVDAPSGTTVSVALAGRGPLGVIPFNTASSRDILGYPNVKAYDAYTNADQVRPLSAYFAGVMCRTDNEKGYWKSPSNEVVMGITGVERQITWDIADKDGTKEATVLNAAGIVTLASGFGVSTRLWGNRSSLYPSDTDPVNFICVQRTRDVVEDSIELAMLPFVDGPINRPLIDSIVETVNQFIRTLIGRGALIDGSFCSFVPEENSETELAAGHIVFHLELMPPLPAERITFLSRINIALLKSILTAA